MSVVTRYTVENADGSPVVSAVFDEDEYREAVELARQSSALVMAYEYEFSDSFVVDDFTTGGES